MPVVALFFAAALCNAATADEPPALAVTIAHPLSEHITTWDEYSGRFVAVKSVEVRPRVSGFIDKVNFIDGAIVKAGDLLFTIDQRPFAIAVESAKAEVARAAAQVKVTAADVERAKPLVGTAAFLTETTSSGRPTLPLRRHSYRSPARRRRPHSSTSSGPR